MPIGFNDIFDKVTHIPDIQKEVDKIQDLHNKLSNDIIPQTNKIAELKQKIEGLPQEIKSKVEEVLNLVRNMVPPPPVAPPLPPPMDPREALRGLAEGLQKAEEILNKKNLVIASGYIDIELQLKVDKEIGASAKIHIDITPKPYN
jgi:hypothetical protein